jgi:ketosteroid isomerase-like protein
MTKSIEERLTALEDINEIIRLKTRYLNACDGGWDRQSHDAEIVVGLFAPDGYLDLKDMGLYKGHDAIRAKFQSFRAELPYAYHMVMNPGIEVNGDTAEGEWHLIFTGQTKDGHSFFAACRYTDTFVRTAEGWKFQSITSTSAYFGNYPPGFRDGVQFAEGFTPETAGYAA